MRRVLTFGLASFVIVLAVGVWLSFFADYSEGFRVGQVIKLSHKGYVFKTWEGTLDQGYLAPQADTGIATRIWDFSVDEADVGLRRDIDAAIAGNHRVKLYYREKLIQWSFRGDTKYFVHKIEPVHAGENRQPPPPAVPAPAAAPAKSVMPAAGN
jgi:hypothetical protein